MKQAAEISANAHMEAMRAVKPGMNEQSIEALYLYEFAKQGGRFAAYTSIVAGGDNACVLCISGLLYNLMKLYCQFQNEGELMIPLIYH